MRKRRGVLTIEAALIIPIITIAVYTMINLMNIIWVYDSVQTSINNTANIVATNSYVVSNTGLSSIVTSNTTNEQLEETLGPKVMSMINGIFSGETTSQDIEDLITSLRDPDTYLNEIRALRNKTDNYYLEYLMAINNMFISIALKNGVNGYDVDSILETTLKVISEESLKNDLGGGYTTDKDIAKRMKSIGIISDFDLEGTEFKPFSNKSDGKLKIKVSYKLDVSTPIFDIDPFDISQQVVVKPWIGKQEG